MNNEIKTPDRVWISGRYRDWLKKNPSGPLRHHKFTGYVRQDIHQAEIDQMTAALERAIEYPEGGDA